jgi:hypothetical protein
MLTFSVSLSFPYISLKARTCSLINRCEYSVLDVLVRNGEAAPVFTLCFHVKNIASNSTGKIV